jgi:hypothetical protein
MSKTIKIYLSNIGADNTTFNLETQNGTVLATNVTKATLIAGYQVIVDDNVTSIIVKPNGECSANIKVIDASIGSTLVGYPFSITQSSQVLACSSATTSVAYAVSVAIGNNLYNSNTSSKTRLSSGWYGYYVSSTSKKAVFVNNLGIITQIISC